MKTIIELLGKAAGPLPLFKKSLRAAIRADLKTMTRRVIKPQPEFLCKDDGSNWSVEWCHTRSGCLVAEWGEGEPVPEEMLRCCPYGQPGQIRYMREPLRMDRYGLVRYSDDNTVAFTDTDKIMRWRWQRDVLPQIFMPKNLARTFVKLGQIRVERLQDIEKDENLEDVFREGLYKGSYCEFVDDEPTDINLEEAVEDFKELWNEINAKRGFGYEVNPWVWVVSWENLEIGE